MRVLSDYRCECGKEFEAYARITDEVRCECSKPAVRLISPVKCQLEGVSGDFPGAAYKWAREHERAARKDNP
jgi:hypothetical protein